VRALLDEKQESLALRLGWSQKTVSKLENRRRIDIKTLQRIADALDVDLAIINQSTATTFQLALQVMRTLVDGTAAESIRALHFHSGTANSLPARLAALNGRRQHMALVPHTKKDN